jgi:hypothetical protein
MLSRSTKSIAAAVSLIVTTTFPLFVMTAYPARAEEMQQNPMTMAAPTVTPVGQTLFEQVRGLEGTWDAQTKLGVLTDVFQPFAYGTAVLGEELLNGKQITSTIFYVVNGELRADHYCDYLNQPRYTAVPSMDPTILDFEFREATNLDTHPTHFHNTKWKIVDSDHLIQDWFILGGAKPISVAHMEFVKRAEGAPAPAPTAMVSQAKGA